MGTKEVYIKFNFSDSKVIDDSYFLDDKQIDTQGCGFATIVVPEDFQISKGFAKKCEKVALARTQSYDVMLRAYLGIRWGNVFKQANSKVNFASSSHDKVLRLLNKLANPIVDGRLQDFSFDKFEKQL